MFSCFYEKILKMFLKCFPPLGYRKPGLLWPPWLLVVKLCRFWDSSRNCPRSWDCPRTGIAILGRPRSPRTWDCPRSGIAILGRPRNDPGTVTDSGKSQSLGLFTRTVLALGVHSGEKFKMQRGNLGKKKKFCCF